MSSPRVVGGGSGSLLWAQGLACGAILAFAPATALLLVLLFWPVLVAFVLDKAPGRPMARAVTLCSAAASIAPVHATWNAGFGMHASLAEAADWNVLALSWCAAAAGWGISVLAPLAVRAVLELMSAARATRLRAARARLLAAWRLDGAGSGPGV